MRKVPTASPASTARSDQGSRPSSPPQPPKTAAEKNKLRRMQIRRAQIHHRQRKANHLKQLELDVCQLRDLIALAEHDSDALRRQNSDMQSSLEHVYWDHFGLGDFHSHTHQSEQPRGHALTASAYLMASAPESFYAQRKAFDGPGSGVQRCGSRPGPFMSWPAPTMSLASLVGLARSLNPGGLETTPVQAWFELASCYHVDLLLGDGALDALLRELKGVVRCVEFGAAIERMAFESVVTRVLGPTAAPLPAVA